MCEYVGGFFWYLTDLHKKSFFWVSLCVSAPLVPSSACSIRVPEPPAAPLAPKHTHVSSTQNSATWQSNRNSHQCRGVSFIEERCWRREAVSEADADDHLQLCANWSISSVGFMELLSKNNFLLLPLSSFSQQLPLQKPVVTCNIAITHHTQYNIFAVLQNTCIYYSHITHKILDYINRIYVNNCRGEGNVQ